MRDVFGCRCFDSAGCCYLWSLLLWWFVDKWLFCLGQGEEKKKKQTKNNRSSSTSSCKGQAKQSSKTKNEKKVPKGRQTLIMSLLHSFSLSFDRTYVPTVPPPKIPIRSNEEGVAVVDPITALLCCCWWCYLDRNKTMKKWVWELAREVAII